MAPMSGPGGRSFGAESMSMNQAPSMGNNPLFNSMMMQKMGQNAGQTTSGSGLSPAMMPFLLSSDRGRNMLATSMAMKNPNVMSAIMMNGGMSDNMARAMAMMSMMPQQGNGATGQGQEQNMLPMFLAMQGGNEFANMFPFLMGGAGNIGNIRCR